MNAHDIVKIGESEVKRLCGIYKVDIPEIYCAALDEDINGKTAKNTDTGKWAVVFNQRCLNDEDSIIHTARHEFRHIWQRVYHPEIADFWLQMTIEGQSHGDEDYYLFSATELDAESFANSGCKNDSPDFLTAMTAEASQRNGRRRMEGCYNWALRNRDLLTANVRLRLSRL